MDDIVNDVEPFEGMTVDETRDLLFRALRDNDSEDRPFKVLSDASMEVIIRRMIQLGVVLGRIIQERKRRAPDAGPSPIPGHPDLSEMFDRIDIRRPDVTLPHGYAQVSLLQAIRRLSDEASTAEDVHLLADAYMSLPAPLEDGFGAISPE